MSFARTFVKELFAPTPANLAAWGASLAVGVGIYQYQRQQQTVFSTAEIEARNKAIKPK